MRDSKNDLPISVVMVTKNEALNLPFSLPPLLNHFDDVLVVDSHSDDSTHDIANKIGATVHSFTWNGHYPKKRQWILDKLPLKYDWVLMIDADEIITDDFINELKHLNFNADGYFIKSDMVWKGQVLKHGMKNNKLCLFHKDRFFYPVVDDLAIEGMGEIEGHYQPLPKKSVTLKQISAPILHHDRKNNWHKRHDHYAMWEIAMTKNKAWPKDPIPWRELLKSLLRQSYLRPLALFTYSSILKLGFLDGYGGFDYAFNRARYTYRIVRAIRQTNG